MVGSHPFHISEPYPNSSSISISAGTLVRPTAQSSSPHPVAIISAEERNYQQAPEKPDRVLAQISARQGSDRSLVDRIISLTWQSRRKSIAVAGVEGASATITSVDAINDNDDERGSPHGKFDFSLVGCFVAMLLNLACPQLDIDQLERSYQQQLGHHWRWLSLACCTWTLFDVASIIVAPIAACILDIGLNGKPLLFSSAHFREHGNKNCSEFTASMVRLA
ncbi:hypothetical protein I7I51_08122 [Histoplasma capsulatum]|uniref:Uncharacterized protein n=1 Tax=Ajellomyces capsulatus TaxID=5037 RepID=A0A8A1M1Q6_AJECA|nr:hypothetical protein I7I51_08122 [Histoplasma capsulatum]